MKEQLEKDGKIISSIVYDKHFYFITFTDNETLKISEATFTDFFLYEKKRVDSDTYNILKDAVNYNNAEKYLMNLISRKIYCSSDLYKKLVTVKKIDCLSAKKIIDKFVERGLIDDSYFVKIYNEELRAKGYSSKYIYNYFKEKGINESFFLNLVDQDDEEILSIIKKAYEKYKNRGNRKKVFSLISDYLFKYGYGVGNGDLIEHYLNDQNSDDLYFLKQDFQKCLQKYSKITECFEKDKKVINYLLNKGYNYSDIKIIMEEINDKDQRY